MADELHVLLGTVRRRWLVMTGARTVGRALIAAAVPLAAAAVADALLAPRGAAPAILGLAVLLASLGAAGAILWRSPRRPTDRQIARFIEEQVAGLPWERPLSDALVSAVDAERGNQAFARLVVSRAVARLREIPVSVAVPRAAMSRALIEGAGGLTVFALILFAARGPILRAVGTGRLLLFPGSIRVSVLPGDISVIAGRPLRIEATIQGAGELLERLTPSLTVSAGNEQRTVAMTRQKDGFAFVFESVDRSFRYRVKAGATLSDVYTVTTLFAPRVERIDLRYVYPAFTSLAPHDESGGGDMYGPVGTRVHLRVQTDRPASSGQLAFGRITEASLRPTADRVLEGDVVLSREDSYRIRLSGPKGLRSDGDTEYFVRLVDDRPPGVRILRPSGDQKITPLEEVPIEARADDDYGLSKFELVYAIAGRPERVLPFTRVTGTAVEQIGTRLLAAEDLHLQPGDVVTYYARARDVARGKQSTETMSDIFFLEVKPFGAEFASAESQAGGASGTQIEALIAAQKDVINATWNLERRSTAGRSAADLKAVADAQEELKRRTEQMAGRPGRRRWPRQPQQIIAPQQSGGAQGTDDPIAGAVDAMTRALQQLQEQRTKDAIPHEMAALQRLLQAQAEVRRRQVTQQRAGSGSGSGREGEDLSALFDKELQRQQRTNYETRSQVEDQPEPQDRGDAADRIRDLAKRQEDLGRRQQDLARSDVSGEERKRQLERLAREQNQLREELEQLARREGRRSGASQQQGQQTSNERDAPTRGDGTSQMRGASGQMREAASELQREAPEAAAASAQRAAGDLRRLEQQMRGGTGASQRATGELQLEAQQIAQEQRRIAAEADRLGGARNPAADEARRRLAADKERLADRVDGLKRSALQAAGEEGKTQASGPRDAARELDEQRLAERMRQTARSMREPARPAADEPQGQGEAERQLARAMDRVVDRLGGQSSSDARRLAGELEQTRQVRERLNELERGIREAEKSSAGQGRAAGRASQGGTSGGRGNEELERLRQEYARELQRARQAFAPNGQGEQRSGAGLSTPEQQEYSRSAPGTEAFKQDFSNWENLRKEIDAALEQHDAALSARLMRKPGDDRLSAGGSERVPDSYRAMIARYYESLAKVKR